MTKWSKILPRLQDEIHDRPQAFSLSRLLHSTFPLTWKSVKPAGPAADGTVGLRLTGAVYNLIFVLLLIYIPAVAAARPTFKRLAYWNLHHLEQVQLALGGSAVAIDFIILATI